MSLIAQYARLASSGGPPESQLIPLFWHSAVPLIRGLTLSVMPMDRLNRSNFVIHRAWYWKIEQ
jgi:hypothetical protein